MPPDDDRGKKPWLKIHKSCFTFMSFSFHSFSLCSQRHLTLPFFVATNRQISALTGTRKFGEFQKTRRRDRWLCVCFNFSRKNFVVFCFVFSFLNILTLECLCCPFILYFYFSVFTPQWHLSHSNFFDALRLFAQQKPSKNMEKLSWNFISFTRDKVDCMTFSPDFVAISFEDFWSRRKKKKNEDKMIDFMQSKVLKMCSTWK